MGRPTHSSRNAVTSPSLADAMRIIDGLKTPAAAKFDGGHARRAAVTPVTEHGLVSIMGPNSLLYANAVGACGAVSAGAIGAD